MGQRKLGEKKLEIIYLMCKLTTEEVNTLKISSISFGVIFFRNTLSNRFEVKNIAWFRNFTSPRFVHEFEVEKISRL